MDLNTSGFFCLAASVIFTLYSLIVGLISALKNKYSGVLSAEQSTLFAALFSTLSILILGYGFLIDDYSNQYIWQFSNKEMASIYKITAVWGGMNGSMLFWGWYLSAIAVVLVLTKNKYPLKLYSFTLPVQMISQLFFLAVTFLVTNPFEYVKADFIPPDGNGLNPLLQNPYMAIHPPMLYMGFTLFSVPFAFAMGALLSNDFTNQWIFSARRWLLLGWSVLSAGIVLGAFWAYIELGWGGFWAWDPVENASFLPWLTGTALVHSVLIQERKGMLKIWNVFLASITYLLTIFGTFLTRSGIVQSVHAFASSDVGSVYLIYLIISGALCGALIFKRRDILKAEKHLESILSRESAFLLNNLILLSICFATIWGVMFPVLSEAVTGSKQTVSAPFFNKVNIPLFMMLLTLMGVGTLIAWRKASLLSLIKTFLLPFSLSLLVAMSLVWAGITSFWPVTSYSICFFVFLTILSEVYRGMRSQISSNPNKSTVQNATSLFSKHSRRYGGYLVHIGVLIMTIAITASMAHKFEKEFTLKKGESVEVGRFRLTLDKLYGDNPKSYEALVASLSVSRLVDNQVVGTLKPEMRYYPAKQETTSEVALKVSPREDLYLVLAGLSDDETQASFKVFVNPLQMWLWIGAIIMVGGGLLIASPLVATKTILVQKKYSFDKV